MIVGVGIDIQSVADFEGWPAEPSKVARFFGPREAEYALSRGAGAAQALAARFAAKEAFGKALGRGLVGLSLSGIQVLNLPSGAPELELGEEALKALRSAGGSRVHLSLSHDGGMAVAAVIVEGGE